jgi:hypothetical protein
MYHALVPFHIPVSSHGERRPSWGRRLSDESFDFGDGWQQAQSCAASLSLVEEPTSPTNAAADER